jgi:hypothetical protein
MQNVAIGQDRLLSTPTLGKSVNSSQLRPPSCVRIADPCSSFPAGFSPTAMQVRDEGQANALRYLTPVRMGVLAQLSPPSAVVAAIAPTVVPKRSLPTATHSCEDEQRTETSGTPSALPVTWPVVRWAGEPLAAAAPRDERKSPAAKSDVHLHNFHPRFTDLMLWIRHNLCSPQGSLVTSPFGQRGSLCSSEHLSPVSRRWDAAANQVGSLPSPPAGRRRQGRGCCSRTGADRLPGRWWRRSDRHPCRRGGTR